MGRPTIVEQFVAPVLNLHLVPTANRIFALFAGNIRLF
jgi:hypothetical protein